MLVMLFHLSTCDNFVFLGFYTGSVYMDIILRRNGFPGEGITDGSVVVVKTHEHGNHVKGAFDKAILLLRQPGDAILAELNRRMAGHRGFVQKSVLEKTSQFIL